MKTVTMIRLHENCYQDNNPSLKLGDSCDEVLRLVSSCREGREEFELRIIFSKTTTS